MTTRTAWIGAFGISVLFWVVVVSTAIYFF